jgi:hypothetical protein
MNASYIPDVIYLLCSMGPQRTDAYGQNSGFWSISIGQLLAGGCQWVGGIGGRDRTRIGLNLIKWKHEQLLRATKKPVHLLYQENDACMQVISIILKPICWKEREGLEAKKAKSLEFVVCCPLPLFTTPLHHISNRHAHRSVRESQALFTGR